MAPGLLLGGDLGSAESSFVRLLLGVSQGGGWGTVWGWLGSGGLGRRQRVWGVVAPVCVNFRTYRGVVPG